MKTIVVVGLLLGMSVLAGCDKEKSAKLEGEIAQMRGESSLLQEDIAARDRYIDEVMMTINQVYKDLELAKSKEAKLVQKATGVEGRPSFTNEEVRKSVLQQIVALGANLKENRKRLSGLQLKLRSSESRFASLDTMLQNMKNTIEEREQAIATLEVQVKGLENTIAENVRVIGEKDMIIETQKNNLNTVYYVIGKEDELKEKGIIAYEGGFLWGLLGSTTVLSSGIDRSHFNSLDVTREQTIPVEGKVKEIVPKRNEEFFALAQGGEKHEDLVIKRPDKFWQDKYLVVIVD